LRAIDEALLGWLLQPAQASPPILATLRALTELGSWWATLSATALAAVFLLIRGQHRRSAALVLVVLTGRLSVDLLKLWLDRPRPALVDYDVVVHSLSFPSGHAGNSTITYLTLALILGPVVGSTRALVAVAALLTFVIGLTRPMLGVHWPTDVLAGWAWGIAWTLSAVWLLKTWMTGRPFDRPPQGNQA